MVCACSAELSDKGMGLVAAEVLHYMQHDSQNSITFCILMRGE